MNENVTYIPNRLKNAAKGGYVTGAVDIIDDLIKKDQQTINGEVVEDLEGLGLEIDDEKRRANGVEQTIIRELENRYTKEEVNNIVSRTPETDVIVIAVPSEYQSDIATWLDENTPSGIDPETGKSVRANKLYRVPGPDNTTFSEWAWDGTAYIPLANKDYGIDDEPVKDSDNMVKGGGIFDFVSKYIRNEDIYNFKFAVEDGEGNVIYGLDLNDAFRIFADLYVKNASIENASIQEVSNVKNINGVDAQKKIDIDNLQFAITDKDDNIFLSLENSVLKVFVDAVLKNINVKNAVFESLNGIKIHNGLGKSGLTFAITDKEDNLLIGISDNGQTLLGTNGNPGRNKSEVYLRNQDKENYLVAAAGAVSPRVNNNLQFLIITDTHTNSRSTNNWVDAGNDFNSVNALIHLGDILTPYTPFQANTINKTLKRSNVSTFTVIGNHDCGEGSRNIGWALDDEQLYNIFIKPSVDNNFFNDGEYQEGKCYWYHNFDRNKIKLIGLYCFDDGNILDDTKWRPIEFDSSYPNVSAGSYVTGDKVNVRGYSKHSFEAVHDITLNQIPNRSYSYTQESDDYPGYKALRSLTWYSEDQLLWFCNLLVDAAESEYDCVVASHHVFSPNCVLDKECRFTDYRRTRLIDYNIFSRFTELNIDIIADIVDAYHNRTSISRRMEAQSAQGPNRDAAHNVYNYDDASAIPSYDFFFDFSNVETPRRVTFICGHEHADAVFRHQEYNDQTGIMFMSGLIENNRDIRRDIFDSRTFDVLTAYTYMPDGNVCLTRIGSDITTKIDTTTDNFVSKTNEIIKL